MNTKKGGKPPFVNTCCGLIDPGIQLPGQVALEHGFQADRPDLAGVAGGAKCLIACQTNLLHRLGGFRQEFAWVKL